MSPVSERCSVEGAGGIALPLAVGIVHPLDTVRTTMQAAVACQKVGLVSNVIDPPVSYREKRPSREVLRGILLTGSDLLRPLAEVSLTRCRVSGGVA